MGNVAITLKILPESPEIDLERLKQDISKKIKVQDVKVEPIAFGLKALKILVIAPDEGSDKIESEIKSIKGVSEVEVESVTLI
ncbi:MAG: elongation factor 1-beta [Candidatus Aenigmatarchaeota archaeon]